MGQWLTAPRGAPAPAARSRRASYSPCTKVKLCDEVDQRVATKTLTAEQAAVIKEEIVGPACKRRLSTATTSAACDKPAAAAPKDAPPAAPPKRQRTLYEWRSIHTCDSKEAAQAYISGDDNIWVYKGDSSRLPLSRCASHLDCPAVIRVAYDRGADTVRAWPPLLS